MKKNIVFLFAHQDDEVGVFHLIKSEITKGTNIIIFYLTNGRHNSKDPDIRNKESLAILQKFNIEKGNVYFLGQEYEVPDGDLYLHLIRMQEILTTKLSDIKIIENLYLPSWEGGHHDHDAVFLIGIMIAKRFNIINKTFQFSLYNAKNIFYPFFKVFSPLIENGKVLKFKIPFMDRLLFITYCLQYHSQYKTWIGLFPFVAIKYLLGYQKLQMVNLERINDKPHQGKLMYEKRKILKWSIFQSHANIFIYTLINKDN